jgi:hypothetical protein
MEKNIEHRTSNVQQRSVVFTIAKNKILNIFQHAIPIAGITRRVMFDNLD